MEAGFLYRTSNIEHRTSNIERFPTGNEFALDVRFSVFGICPALRLEHIKEDA